MKFVAFERTLQGTGASRRLRNADKVPGIVYGGGEPAHDRARSQRAVPRAEEGSLPLVASSRWNSAAQTQQVLLRDFQMHPCKQIVLHVDFQRVDATTRMHKKVPLHFINEENSPAVKTDKCLVNHVVDRPRGRVPGLAAARVHRASTWRA